MRLLPGVYISAFSGPPGRYIQALALATNPGFNDLKPPDGGWSQNPMLTVFIYVEKRNPRRSFHQDPLLLYTVLESKKYKSYRKPKTFSKWSSFRNLKTHMIDESPFCLAQVTGMIYVSSIP